MSVMAVQMFRALGNPGPIASPRQAEAVVPIEKVAPKPSSNPAYELDPSLQKKLGKADQGPRELDQEEKDLNSLESKLHECGVGNQMAQFAHCVSSCLPFGVSEISIWWPLAQTNLWKNEAGVQLRLLRRLH